MPEANVPDIDLPMSARTAMAFAWAAWVLVVAGTVAGALAALALVPEFWRQVAAAVSVIGFLVAAELRRQLPSAKAMRTTIVGGLLVLMVGAGLLTGCPNAYGPATKTTAGLMRATNTTSKAAAAMGTEEHIKCLKLGNQTTAYMTCITPALKRLTTYRDNVRPAARSAVGAAYAGIVTARAAGKKPLNYQAVLSPGVCAIILMLREWGHKLPDQGAGILPLLDGFSPLVCDKPKSAAALVIALLPVAVDLVKWIVQLVGADSADLEREIYAWITAKPADEVDAVIATIQAALPVAP